MCFRSKARNLLQMKYKAIRDMQKENAIQYPRFIKLITADLIEKYELIPKRLEEEYHTIKDCNLLVNMYTTGKVTVHGMQISNDLLTDAIRDTQAYKDYVEKYEGVVDIIEKVSESLKETVPKIATSATNDLINNNPSTLMESDLQSQVADPELWYALKAKYKNSSTSTDSCRYDAFSKSNHDEHQGDDAPFGGEKGVKRQKASRSSKLIKEEIPELIDEFQNVDKCVPTIFNNERMEDTIRDMLVWESRHEDLKRPQPEALVFYGPQRNSKEPPMYLYNKDLFFLKNGNTKEKNFEAYNPYFIIDEHSVGLIYLNKKEEKTVMNLVDILKFCDATLEKVLNEVKLEIFEIVFKMKTQLLGELDLKIMKAYEREIMKRLKHRKQMRRWESFVNGRSILQSMKRQ
nr:hypothetical protein [Tanacetum cinerariifolium]